MQRNPITGQPYSKGYRPGAEFGAITLEWRKPVRPVVLECSVRSFTDRARRYRIEVNRYTLQVRCSCDAYRFALDRRDGEYATLDNPGSGWCKHIACWQSAIADEINETVVPR